MAYLVYLVYGNEVKLKEEQATISILIMNDFGIRITNQMAILNKWAWYPLLVSNLYYKSFCKSDIQKLF